LPRIDPKIFLTVNAATTDPTGPVRVLHVFPHAGGGAETYVDTLERLDGFVHQRVYLSSGRAPVDALASIPLTLPQLAARLRRADLIQTHGDVATVLASPLLRARPSVMTGQGLHMLRRLSGPRRTVFVRALRAAISGCRFVICSSTAERTDLERIARPADRSKLCVVDNGIDTPAPVGEAKRQALRDELGVPDDVVLGVFVGQLERRKAPILAASAAIRVRQAGIPFVLALAGDGPEAEALQALAGEAVRTLGYRADVPELLAAADLFVQTSEREGMSFALLEAMAHGLAIVASDGPGNPEAVDDAGLLFRAGDEGALVAALTKVCTDSSLRNALGANASSRASERFSVEQFLASVGQVYRRALAATAPARDAGASRA
jgi:glycosyltransferase involved in cell wall biosynthesis